MRELIAGLLRYGYTVARDAFLWIYNIARKMEIKKCGKGSCFHGLVKIRKPENLVIGDYVQIGANSRLYADGGIEIGDNTQIAPGLVVYSVNHSIHGKRLPYDEDYKYEKVTIGRNVWIGAGVKITPGVSIGEGAVIGMGTVVSRDVPALAIAAGQAYRIIGHRDKKHYERLCKEKKFAGREGRPIE